jgi:hypothetical protein
VEGTDDALSLSQFAVEGGEEQHRRRAIQRIPCCHCDPAPAADKLRRHDQIRLAAPNAKIRFISYPSVFGTGSGVACSGGTGTSAWAYTTDERSTCRDC